MDPLRPQFRDVAAEALTYWEPRRLVYNAVLVCIVVGYFAAAWPASRTLISIDAILGLFLVTIVANILYCAAYVVDIFVQFSALREPWLKRRWVLFAIGFLSGTRA